MAKYLDATGVSTLWSKVKEYGTTTASAAVKTITDTKGAKNGIASLDSNGYVPLSQLGNLDTTFAEVVSELPTSNIKKHLYLVKSSSTSQNLYSEYIYTGDTTATYDASKWEKLGEYKADVDLSEYAKKTEAVTSLEWQYSSDNDRIYIIPRRADGTQYRPVEVPPATTTTAGLMSKEDYDTFHNGMLISWTTTHDGDELDIKYYAMSDTKQENPLTELCIGGATLTHCGLMTSSDKSKLDYVSNFVDDYEAPFIYFNKGTGTAIESTTNDNTYIRQSGLDHKNNIKGTGATTVSSDGTNLIINSTDTHYTSKNVVASTANGTTNGSATGTVYLNHVETTGLTSSHAIKSGTNTLVSSDASGNITITSSNTHVNTAAFTADKDKVTLTLTMNDGSKVTADIPEPNGTEGEEATGLLTYAQYIYLTGTLKECLDKNPEKGATADSAITATELAAILV